MIEGAKHSDAIWIDLDVMKEERGAFQMQLITSQVQHEEELEKFNKIQIDLDATKQERDTLELQLAPDVNIPITLNEEKQSLF